MSALISDTEVVTLESSSGLWRAEVHPMGASLVTLSFDGHEIVISPYGKTFFAFAGATLAPWPNRLEDGTWVFADKTLKHTINDERGHNSNHGLVFDRKFAVVSQSADSIDLEISLGDDEVYPFASKVSVSYRLDAEGLHSTIAFTNHDGQLIPVAIGAHPYFLLDDNSEVELNAQQIVQKSSRLLPLQTIDIAESDFAKNGRNLVSELELDDCFTGLIENADSKYSTRISRPSFNSTVELWQDTVFKYLMVFILREQGEDGRDSIAIEPQSAPANAFRSNDDLTWLAPEQSVSASWGITIKEGIFND